MKCKMCGNDKGRAHVCNSDGQLHRHGMIHFFNSGFGTACSECHKSDWLKWNPQLTEEQYRDTFCDEVRIIS